MFQPHFKIHSIIQACILGFIGLANLVVNGVMADERIENPYLAQIERKKSKWLPHLTSTTASYPETCHADSVRQGICLLGSENPRANTTFIVRQVLTPIGGYALQEAVELKLNEWLELPSGVFEVFRSDKIDESQALRFNVDDGEQVILKTATVEFPGVMAKLLVLQPSNQQPFAQRSGCKSLWHAQAVEAFLPGSYHITQASKLHSGVVNIKTMKEEGKCFKSGFSFLLSPGETVQLGLVKINPERLKSRLDLSSEQVFTHHTGAQALTSIDRTSYPVTYIALVSQFRSFDPLTLPGNHSADTDVLLLWGLNTFFAIPVKIKTALSCGISLAKGEEPAHNLLTHCQFDSEGHLTDFKVNRGRYFGYSNRSGYSGPGIHTINDTVQVTGLSWNIEYLGD